MWKEQFDKQFPFSFDERIPIKEFISNEVVERIIKDIPDLDTWVDGVNVAPVARSIKQYLRDKWL